MSLVTTIFKQPDKKLEIETFTDQLAASLDDANIIGDGEGDDLHSGIRCEEDETTPTPEDYGDMHTDDRPDDDDKEAVNNYLNVELIMNMGTNDERWGRVVKRSRGLDSEPIGCAHANPLFDTREYEIEFNNGTHEKYQANVIAENMFAQVDDEGNQPVSPFTRDHGPQERSQRYPNNIGRDSSEREWSGQAQSNDERMVPANAMLER
jgi:hypothetical protein